jgi:hypothetical protein
MEQQRNKRMWPYVLLAAAILCDYWYLRNRPGTSQSLTTQDVIAEMQSRAQLALTDAKDEFDVVLDFSPDSVESLESVLAQIHELHAANPIPDAELNRHALKWGGYVGEVIKRVRTAEWKLDSDVGGDASLPIVYDDDSESFPVRWCYKRIINGDEDNVWHKFTLLAINRDTDFGDAITFAPGDADGDAEVAEQPDEREPE